MQIKMLNSLPVIIPLFIRQIALLFFALGFSIFFARHYDISLFASYSNTIILLYFALAIGDGAFYIPLMNEDNTRTLIDSAFSRHQIICTIIMLFLIVFSLPISNALFVPPILICFFAVSLVFMPFQSVNQFFFEKKGIFKTNVFNEVTQSAVFFISLWLAFYIGGGFRWAGLAFVMRMFVGCLLAYHWSRYQPRFSVKVPYLSLPNSLRLMAINVMGFLNSIAGPLVLGHFFSISQVAAVNWSISNASYVQQPFIILNRFLIPFFSNKNEVRILNVYRVFSIFYFATLILIFGLSGTILGLVYGQKWMIYINVFYAVLLTTFLVPISVPTGAFAAVSGRSNFILRMNVIRLILFWGVLIVFSKLNFGVWSYIYAQIIAEILHVPTFFIVMRSLSKQVVRAYAMCLTFSSPCMFGVWYYIVRQPDQLNILTKSILVLSLVSLFLFFTLCVSKRSYMEKNEVSI